VTNGIAAPYTGGMLARLLVLAVIVVVSGVGSGSSATKPQVLVTVSASGGLCPPSMCHWGGRITTTTISADGRYPRRLSVGERRTLTRAIAVLQPTTLPPFKGTCPIAYDGQERHYRFVGKRELRSCKYDLRNVRAVQLADRLLASLKPR
jgi:hypothetical protein